MVDHWSTAAGRPFAEGLTLLLRVHWHPQVDSRAGRLRTAEIFGEIADIALESVAESIIG